MYIFLLPIILAAPVVAIGALIYIVVSNYIESKYRTFALEHSAALKKLKEINAEYIFKDVEQFNVIHFYDNANMFSTVSPRDYLTHWLVNKQNNVCNAIKATNDNKKLFEVYQRAVKDNCKLNIYDTASLPRDTKKLEEIEKRIFRSKVHQPCIEFSIEVCLYPPKGYGRNFHVFKAEDIEEIIRKLNNKRGEYYSDDDIWRSLSSVERSLVSNELRFAIYRRDNYRCRKCGRETQDLEIDHIYPISKGGKTTYNNLQTLCHACNYKKSNNIERPINNRPIDLDSLKTYCPQCGGFMKEKIGKYGKFYGCSNYPRCNYVEKK